MTGFVSGGPHTSSISNAGGIVGGNYDGIVEYCNNTATVAGDYNVGGIVGSNRTGAVFRCYNAGVVYGRYDAVGGISGKNESGLNRSCFNKETVTADGYNAGGIAGVISQGAVEDCYNISPVTGEDNVGGVVGKNSDGWIKTSYNIGKAEVGDFVGGVLGRMDEGHVESCYYLDTCVPAYSSSYGTKLTDEEMWDEENFAGFDFVNIWAIEDGFNYPRFIYELPTELGGDSAVWDGTVAEGFAGGEGTKNKPYLIENAAQLAYFAKTVNEGNSYAGKYIKLDNEIILNRKDVPNWTLNASPWTPIGADSPFEGYFDGGDYTIRGVYIDSVRFNLGIFGQNKGTVVNLGVEPYYFRGYFNVAAVVAHNDGGLVDNSYNLGDIYGCMFIGGVVGLNEEGTVRYCYNEGAVFGYNVSGGVVGANDEGIVTDCYNSGAVGGDWGVGGVVGLNEEGTVRYCYNEGAVFGYKVSGGVAGNMHFSMLRDCYNLGAVSGYSTVGGIFGYSYLSHTDSCYNRGTVTASDDFGGIAGDNEASTLVNCYYLDTTVSDPTNDFGKALTEAQMLQKDSYEGFDFVLVWALLSDDSLHPYPQFLKYLDPALGEPSSVWDGSIADVFADGDGSEEDPYRIKTAKQLALFAYLVNDGVDFSDEYIVLENDIVLNDITKDKWILNANKWKPIGISGDFRGTFDGRGYSVSGVYIDEGAENSGLFATNSGIIKNVGVTEAYIKGSNNVGGVVGFNKGTIDGCFFDGTVTGNSAVGGVVGSNEYTVINSYNSGTVIGSTDVGGVLGVSEQEIPTISACYNSGRVLGAFRTGGIVGSFPHVQLERCYNLGDINGCLAVGGIVGAADYSYLAYCYNTGSVSGWNYVAGIVGDGYYCYLNESYNKGEISGDYYVGGLMGENSFGSISDGYNAGRISGAYYVGGIVGSGYLNNIERNYNIGTVSGDHSNSYGALVGGEYECNFFDNYYLDSSAPGSNSIYYTALTETQMRNQDSFEGFDFEAIWDIGPEADYPYPTLRNLTVTPAEPIAVTGVSLDKTSLTVKVGKTASLIATVKPENASDKAVTWTSDDETIATVDNSGLVTAVSPGTVTITVTTADGGFFDSCIVTVEPNVVTEITIDKPTLTLKAGGTGKLTAVVEPADAENNDIIWETSDDSVATVDENGNVTAVGVGTAIITARTSDCSVVASCEVTVEPVMVTGISLNKSSLTLKTGKTGTLTAIIEPADATDKAVRWTSSRSSIATVDKNGVVTALRPGTVTIKVTTVDGGFSATCTVKVEPVKVTGISPDKPSFTLKAGETGTLTAIVKPADAFSKDVLWLTSDYTVAEVSPQGVVRALKAGTAIISATTVDGGYTAYFTVTVTQDNIAVKPGSSYGTNKHDTILYNVSPGTTVNELLNNLAGGSFEVRNAKGEKLSGNAVIGTGAVVNLIADGKVIDSLLISVRGDIDGDGKVTAADARLVLRHVAKLQTLSELEMHSADIDGESCIKAADARLILRAAAKLETL